MNVTIGDRVYEDGKPLLMGVLNITPDSFSDGGRYFDTTRAVVHAHSMVSDGADIIDIGGESSRPGAEPVGAEEELLRILPVIEALDGEIAIPISVDTCKSEVAEKALRAGAAIVNDISALTADEGMADVIAEAGASVVLMHMRGTPRTMQKSPEYKDVVGEVIDYLSARVDYAVSRGVAKSKIIVDPGIGFGKTLGHNLALLQQIGRLHELGCPVLVGASRKSMIGAITGAETDDRSWGTAAVTAHCVGEGIELHRVHDIREMRQVADVAAAIRNVSGTGNGRQ